jgi:hypothetical protein
MPKKVAPKMAPAVEVETMEGRCMRCKQQREFVVQEKKEMKNGTSMAKGPCSICGTTVCRMLGKTKPVSEAEEEETF